MWLIWHKVRPKCCVTERKLAKAPTACGLLGTAHTKMAQAKALLEETCADHFTEEVPSAIRTALSSLAEADGMLVESKKMVDSVVKQLSLYQATQRKRKSAAIANDKDWRGNRDLEFQKTLPRSVRKRVHEQMAEIAGNSSETERRNAYEKSVRYTVSWKTGRKP